MKMLVFLPTYNEKDNIEEMVEAILPLEHHPLVHKNGIHDLHILIVDDNSPDGTGEIADKLALKSAGKICVIHRSERGRGTAGVVGFKYALQQQYDYLIEMDADFSHDPNDIPRLLEEAKGCDIVIGSRFVTGSKIGPRSAIRKVTSWGAGLYTRTVLGLNIRDWSSGYKCYHKRALAGLDFDSIHSKGYSIGMETLYMLAKSAYTYKEIPITFPDRVHGESKYSSKEGPIWIKVALELRFHRRAKRPGMIGS